MAPAARLRNDFGVEDDAYYAAKGDRKVRLFCVVLKWQKRKRKFVVGLNTHRMDCMFFSLDSKTNSGEKEASAH